MINKTQNQSFGALRFDRGAKKLKGVRPSIEEAYKKVAATHHVFVQDKGYMTSSFKGYPLVTVLAQSKSKLVNWVFEKFPASTVSAHRLAKRPVSRMQSENAIKSETLTTKIADAIEQKIPALTSERIKLWGGGAIRVLTLGALPESVHLGKASLTPKYAEVMIDEALINLNSKKPSAKVINPFFEKAVRENAESGTKLLQSLKDDSIRFPDVDTSLHGKQKVFIKQAVTSAPENPKLATPVDFSDVDTVAIRRQKAFIDGVLRQVQDSAYKQK